MKANPIESKNPYCIAPWTALYVQHDGSVFPCCHWTRFDSLGNLHESSFKDIWNSEKTKKLRLEMLQGESPANCVDCRFYESIGEKSLRLNYKESQNKYLNRAAESDSTGHFEKLSLIYLSVGIGVQCQLQCRTCGPTDSSSWQNEEQQKLKYGSITQEIPKTYLKNLIANSNELERLLFVGGEPIINLLHYEILELVLKNATQKLPDLFYNTNLFQLEWRSFNVFDYWKYFRKVNLFVSIDGDKKRFGYLRTGHNWKRLEKNISYIRENAPNVNLTAYVTISNYNFYFLSDVLDSLFELNFEPNQILFNFVKIPEHMSVINAPQRLKENSIKKNNFLIKKLISKYELSEVLHLIKCIQSLNYFILSEEPNDHKFREFLIFNKVNKVPEKFGSFEQLFFELINENRMENHV